MKNFRLLWIRPQIPRRRTLLEGPACSLPLGSRMGYNVVVELWPLLVVSSGGQFFQPTAGGGREPRRRPSSPFPILSARFLIGEGKGLTIIPLLLIYRVGKAYFSKNLFFFIFSRKIYA